MPTLMKKLFRILLALVLILTSSRGCAAPPSLDQQIPPGCSQKEEHFDPEGFQDYTDYCKYFYPNAYAFEIDARWHRVSEAEAEEIRGYFDNFRQWMETEDRLAEYDFDPGCIGTEDYVRLEIKEGYWSKYDDYTVYFFDADSCILYYIHSNI